MNQIKYSENIVEQKVEEGLLLLREDGNYLLLNHSAAKIWKIIPKANTTVEIVNKLSNDPSAPNEEELAKFVGDFLQELLQKGFLKS